MFSMGLFRQMFSSFLVSFHWGEHPLVENCEYVCHVFWLFCSIGRCVLKILVLHKAHPEPYFQCYVFKSFFPSIELSPQYFQCSWKCCCNFCGWELREDDKLAVCSNMWKDGERFSSSPQFFFISFHFCPPFSFLLSLSPLLTGSTRTNKALFLEEPECVKQ